MSTLATIMAERDEALEQVRYLKSVLAEMMDFGFDCPGEDARFTKYERCVLSILKAGEGHIIRRSALYSAIYSLRPDGDLVVEKIIDVWICKLRRKLKRHSIETVWGVGWRLMPIPMEKAARA